MVFRWSWIACLATASPVLAAGGEGASNPFAGDIGNALWTIVIFLVVVVVLGKFAWGPILDALQKRETFIRDSLAQAKHDREDAERKLKELTDRLNTARQEATAIVDEGRRDAEVVKHRIEQEARSEADRMIERARREIGIATETAVKEIYTLGSKLATDVASRVIRKELSGTEHDRLINESIDEFKKAYSSRN